jgi:peptidoglycan hydrolase-like protein with peptidoglycan-binding domain
MSVPIWYKREITLGAMGPDVRIVRRKLGFPENGSYDRAVQSKVMGMARKAKLDTTAFGTVDEDVAALLGDETSTADPSWFVRDRYVLGDMGVDVADIHKAFLPHHGYDDRYRADLEAAIRRFQSNAGLDVTGEIDSETARHIGEFK